MTVATVVGMAIPNTREKALSYRRVELDGNVAAIASKAAAVIVMRIIKEKSGQAR